MNASQKEYIKQMYLELYDMLFEYADSVLKNPARAEEAVQETFRIACQKPQELISSPNPRGWIINTLKHTIQNTRHELERDKRLLAEYLVIQNIRVYAREDSVSLELQYGDMVHLEEYKLLEDMVLKGKSHLEMARERGITVDACRKRVERAKKILKKYLK